MFSDRHHSARVLCRMADQLGYFDSGNIKERERNSAMPKILIWRRFIKRAGLSK